jgi:Arylsulfotransferase (ASST)
VAGCAIGRTSPATDVTGAGATLRGAVESDRAQTVSWWFAYGTSTAYGSETARRQLTVGGRSRTPVSEPVGGLQPGITYHFRLCAQAPGFDAFCGDDRTFTTEAAPPTELSIAARPALYPAFAPDVTDYVTRCGSDPVAFDVEAPEGTGVAVDGRTARSGRFSENVQLAAGQSAAITATAQGSQTFHVRCLPANFPTWTHERSGQPSQGWTVVSVVMGLSSAQYVVFFDNRGVPVWWYHPPGVLPFDAKLLSDDSVAFSEWSVNSFNANPARKYQVRRLDGTLVRTLQTVDVPTDFHELQELPNGNYLLVAYKPRDHVDLSAYGKSSDSTVLDAEIQEITPQGARVWNWNSKDHIDLDETGRWWNTLNPGPLPDGRQAIDHLHINAVEPDGDGVLLSMRHTDAIYRISRADGHVEWKLGGTNTPESLTVAGDRAPPATLGAQHDVRRVPDGTVSVYDNGTGLGRPPRAARFSIDTGAGTATLIESVADPDIPTSPCCGSARKLDSNGWLVAWGGQPVVAEYGVDGTRLVKLQINGASLYRAVPVPAARLSAQQLRQAMDTMFPRGGSG